MLNTTLRQPTNRPSPETPRKLRDSCTDCATSKVKCSKDKPTCARCTRRGVACVYMVSRRTGRTSSHASRAGLCDPSQARGKSQIWAGAGASISGPARVSGTGAGGKSALASLANIREPSRSRPPSLQMRTPLPSKRSVPAATTIDTGHPIPRQIPVSTTGADLWSVLISPSMLIADSAGVSPSLQTVGSGLGDLFECHMGFDSPMMLDCPSEQPRETDLHVGLFGDLPLSRPDLEDSHNTFDPHDNPVFDWTLPDVFLSPKESHNCCFTIALNVLSQLFLHSPARCSLPGSRGSSGTQTPDLTSCPGTPSAARSVDPSISNPQIIESLSTILDCDCSQDEYLISLMTLITLKLMGGYTAAAASEGVFSPSTAFTTPLSPSTSPLWLPPSRPMTATSTSASESSSPIDRRPSTSSSCSGHCSLAEHVLDLPLTYSLPDQHPSAAQLVLNEVHRVQKLVTALSARLESVRLRAAMVEGASSGSTTPRRGKDGTLSFSVPTFCLLEQDLKRGLRRLSREIGEAIGGKS